MTELTIRGLTFKIIKAIPSRGGFTSTGVVMPDGRSVHHSKASDKYALLWFEGKHMHQNRRCVVLTASEFRYCYGKKVATMPPKAAEIKMQNKDQALIDVLELYVEYLKQKIKVN